jgi:hypothetical protein
MGDITSSILNTNPPSADLKQVFLFKFQQWKGNTGLTFNDFCILHMKETFPDVIFQDDKLTGKKTSFDQFYYINTQI